MTGRLDTNAAEASVATALKSALSGGLRTTCLARAPTASQVSLLCLHFMQAGCNVTGENAVLWMPWVAVAFYVE